MWADYSMTALCEMNYKNFPNDRQRCCFKLDDRRFYVVRFKVSEMARKEASISGLKVASFLHDVSCLGE